MINPQSHFRSPSRQQGIRYYEIRNDQMRTIARGGDGKAASTKAQLSDNVGPVKYLMSSCAFLKNLSLTRYTDIFERDVLGQ